MCKRMTIVALCLTLLFSTQAAVFATEVDGSPGMIPEDITQTSTEVLPQSEVIAEPTAVEETETATDNTPEIYLEGVLMEDTQATLINGTTYVSFTALVTALRPDAAITWENSCAVARAEGLEISAKVNANYLYANGRYLYVPDGIVVINDRVLVPVRTLAQALSAVVWWDNSVRITAYGEEFLWADEVYNDYDLSLLTAIIYCESGSQPLEGKIAVGNVVLNRVSSSLFPSTVYDVLVQPNQFYGSVDGILTRTPNEESAIAAKLCLEGTSILSNAYWFNGVGKTFWASQYKTLIAVIGDHAFYG